MDGSSMNVAHDTTASVTRAPWWARQAYDAHPTVWTAFGYWILATLTFIIQPQAWLWPASGIAIAAALIQGPRAWQGVALGILLMIGTVWVLAPGQMTMIMIPVSIALAAGTALATLIAALLIRRSRSGSLESPLAVLHFGVVTIGAYSLLVALLLWTFELFWGVHTGYFHQVMSNYAGIVMVAPVCLFWYESAPSRLTMHRMIELAAVLLLLVLFGMLVFTDTNLGIPFSFRISNLILVPIMYAAVRFERQWTSILTAIAFLFIWLGTAQGMGTFAANYQSGADDSVQIFISFVGLLVLMIGSVFEQLHTARITLSRSNTMLGQVLNALPLSVFWKNRESIYLGCNEKFARLVGEEGVQGIVGRRDDVLAVPRRDISEVWAEDAAVVQQGIMKHIIESQQNADAEELWMDITKVPLRDDAGEIYGVLGILMDITERKIAERDLEMSEERFRGMFDAAPFAIMMVTTDHRILEWNRQAEQMLGYTREEAVGRTPFDLFLEESSFAPAEETVNDIIGADKADVMTFNARRSDGTIINVEWRITTIHDSEGNVVATLSSGIDITNRLRDEARLRTSEERLKGIVEAAPFALVIWEIGSRIVEWNRKAEQMLGWKRDEVLGRNFFELITPADALAPMQSYVYRIVNHGYEGAVMHRNLTRSGEVISGEWRSTLLHDADGKALFGLSTGHDVTDRLRREDQLRRQIEELQRWHELTLNREGRIQQLKLEVNDLLLRLGESERYASVRRKADSDPPR